MNVSDELLYEILLAWEGGQVPRVDFMQLLERIIVKWPH